MIKNGYDRAWNNNRKHEKNADIKEATERKTDTIRYELITGNLKKGREVIKNGYDRAWNNNRKHERNTDIKRTYREEDGSDMDVEMRGRIEIRMHDRKGMQKQKRAVNELGRKRKKEKETDRGSYELCCE